MGIRGLYRLVLSWVSYSKLYHTMDLKTIVFLDCETTGLPSFEHNRTKITELCLIAVESNQIALGVFPRIQNKLSLCFNPRKLISPESTNITGMSNELLEHQCEFTAETVDVIRKFLSMQRQPVCFAAHNGNGFDYPILRAEISKTGLELGDEVLCMDTLKAFRSLLENKNEEVVLKLENNEDEVEEPRPKIAKMSMEEIQKRNETTPEKQKIVSVTKRENVRRRLNFKQSYKLGDVYKRLTTKEPLDAHKAEVDVNMLMECSAVLGEQFVEWARNNAVKFCDIPMMVPGKRIGT